jgi:hypothetical protein
MTVKYDGEAGKHRDGKGRECEGRIFDVKAKGTGGVYADFVECVRCQRELVAFGNQVSPEPE